MGTRGNWRFGAALLAGLWASAAWADDQDSNNRAGWGRGPGLLTKWFGSKPSAETKKSVAAAKEAAKKQSPPANPAAGVRSRELADYLRRMAVCDQLLQVAYDTKDEDLQRRAEQLKDCVWTTYQLRTERAAAGGKKFESDEQILDKHLGSKASAKDGRDEVLLGSAPAKGRAGRTARLEDKP